MISIINYSWGLTEMNQRILLSVIAVIGALFFSSYTGAESQAQQDQAPSKIKGAISFKGIPLGKPGITDALQKMCKSKKFNITNDRCSFAEGGSMMLVDYESASNVFALVTLNGEKAITKVAIEGSTQEMLALAKALEKKYGAPLKKHTTVKKAIGMQLSTGSFGVDEEKGIPLDKEIFVWVDDKGSRIIVESIYSEYDKGGAIIELAPAEAGK